MNRFSHMSHSVHSFKVISSRSAAHLDKPSQACGARRRIMVSVPRAALLLGLLPLLLAYLPGVQGQAEGN